jgi:hypothetical protein
MLIIAQGEPLQNTMSVAQLLKKLPAFIEPEGSLPCLQEPATSPYPEPDESSPHPPFLFL